MGNIIGNFITDFANSWRYTRIGRRNSPFNITPSLIRDLQFNTNKPNWISLVNPRDFEEAARFNPIVKAAINLLATSSSNGKKVARDIKTGEIIPWTDSNPAIKKAFELLVHRPNPLQSGSEFAFQGTFYRKVFGNRYVYPLMPLARDKKIDLLKINALYNLPSQFIQPKITGKIWDQTEISGIISDYALTNEYPIRHFDPNIILHFNEVNISSDLPSIMGISKIEVLKMPITNTQKAFEAMNTILTSRGMQGILSPNKRDGMGGSVALTDKEKIAVDSKFKKDYGLLNSQNPFLLTPVPLEYTKTLMNSQELGIYQEFSNNSMLISNEYGVPPELVKTYIQGATYENQKAAVQRLYQDTTIPMVEDEDSYWTLRLNTREHGFIIGTTWDHIPALTAAFKEKALALKLKGNTAKDAYDQNIITWNQYLELIELPVIAGTEGDKLKKDREAKNGEGTED